MDEEDPFKAMEELEFEEVYEETTYTTEEVTDEQ